MPTCYIIGAGEFTSRGLLPQDGDLIIAADGGLLALEAMGIQPDLIIGDLDSLGAHPLPEGVPIEKHPVEKDDTDTGIALAQGWSMGYRTFALYGCGGGRIDHLLANFQSMCRYSQLGAKVRLADRSYDAYALSNGSMVLPRRRAGTIVSIFCHGTHANGVTLRGLHYPLNHFTLTCNHPLGVSNQHTEEEAEITVTEGTLLILQHLDREV